MTDFLAQLQARLALFALGLGERLGGEDREAGQTSAEYIGIIAVVVAIVLIVIAGASGIGGKIVTGIGAQIDKLTA
jgi:Flp pilus assembly pilin Flp